jgi:hypothetical protein
MLKRLVNHSLLELTRVVFADRFADRASPNFCKDMQNLIGRAVGNRYSGRVLHREEKNHGDRND